MDKKVVVVFDFDSTLTLKDTLIEFIKFAKGVRSYYIGLLWCSPILLGYLLKLIPNYYAKEYLFSYFFKNMRYECFSNLGKQFAEKVDRIVRAEVFQKLEMHQSKNHRIYVVSASIEEWVRPWCAKNGVQQVLGTQIEVKEGVLTGRFLSKNCYGEEKVVRLLEVEPDRDNYFLYAYGDSRGDKEMLNFADKGEWVK